MEPNVLKALGDPKRFQMLQLMAERSYCVRALARRVQLTESAVSQHLKILREAGLVCGIRIGYYTHYRVERDALGRVIEELEAHGYRITSIAGCSRKCKNSVSYDPVNLIRN